MEEIRYNGSRRVPGDVVEKWEKGQRRRYRVDEKGRLERITLDGRPWPTESGKP